MSDKISAFRALLLNLSRLPGLSFLNKYEGTIRDAQVGVEDYGDQVHDLKAAAHDVGDSAKQVVQKDED